MRVLLIKPPWSSIETGTANPPVGLAYLAAAIEDIVDTVSVLNADYWRGRVGREEYVFVEGKPQPDAEHKAFHLVERVLEDLKPDVVGISLMTPEYVMAKKLIALVRRMLPSAVIIIGGIHVTLKPAEALQDLGADFALTGEGEKGFRAFIEAVQHTMPFEEVPRLWRLNNKTIVPPRNHDSLTNVDTIPMPAYKHIINPDCELINYGMVFTSRGCPAACTFCATRTLWPGKVRTNTVERIMREVVFLYEEFGVHYIRFVDDTFTANRANVLSLCEHLKHCHGLTWSADTQACLLDRDLLIEMREAGCVQINIGVETGSERMFKNIKKGGRLSDIISCIKCADELGLGVVAYFIIGFPGEDKEDLDATYELVNNLPAYPIVSLATPYPGTEMYEEAKKYLSQEELSDYSQLHHHTHTVMNMTELSDDDWHKEKIRFHECVKRLDRAYNMPAHHKRLRDALMRQYV